MDLTVLRVVVGVVIVIILMPVVINSAPKQSWGQSTRFSSFLCWFCLCDVESSLDVSTVHSSWVKQSWSESPPGLVVNITWLILGARPAAGQLRKSAGQGWGLGWNSVMSATRLLKFTKLYALFLLRHCHHPTLLPSSPWEEPQGNETLGLRSGARLFYGRLRINFSWCRGHRKPCGPLRGSVMKHYFHQHFLEEVFMGWIRVQSPKN